MKWYYWLGLGILAWLFLRPKTTAAAQTPQQVITSMTDEANANWPGGIGDPSKIHEADQNLYPGFWQNEYGGFYNPDTGDSYSPGSSPVVLGRTAAQIQAEDALGESQGVAINQANTEGIARAALIPESDPGYVVY